MSASTVSITANTATRRRPVVVSEQKKIATSIELFPANGTPLTAVAQLANDEIAAGAKDPSNHMIRGEDVTSKEAVPVKKTPSTTRTRRASAAAKAEKPRWLTVVSIFTKNFTLMVVLLGLFQLIRRLVVDYGKYSMVSDGGVFHPGMTDFEGRISEVEKLVKTTTKMVQVQVEAVDKMVEAEVGGLKREFDGKINEKFGILEKELGSLVNQNDMLRKSVTEIQNVNGNFASRAEFEKLHEELKQKGGVEDIGLEDVKLYAKEIIEKEIAKHAADGLGMVDYALAAAGASVLKHSEPFISSKLNNFLAMAGRGGVHPSAVKMLTPSFGEPGQCFPLKGSEGYVVVRLRAAIIPEAITLEHVAKSVAYDRSSAPRACRLSGWLANRESDVVPSDASDSSGGESMFRLVEFTYDLEKSNAQTYSVDDQSSVGLVDTVRLDFLSNHGSPSHTCIYRMRVHGHVPDASLLPVK